MTDRSERRQKLLAKFAMVARERIVRLGDGFQRIEEDGPDDTLVADLMREIHTLKGESRLMGFSHINEVSHRTEDLMAWLRDREFRLSAEHSDLITFGLDILRAELEIEDGDRTEVESRTAQFYEQVAAVLGGAPAAAPKPGGAPAAAPKPGGAEAAADEAPGEAAADEPKAARRTSRKRKKTAASKSKPAASKRSAGADAGSDESEDTPPKPVDSAGPKAARPAAGTAPAPAGTQPAAAETAEPALPAPDAAPAAGRGAAGRGRVSDFVRVSSDKVSELTNLSADLSTRHESIERTLARLGIRLQDEAPMEQLVAELRELRESTFETRLRLQALQDLVRELRLLEVQTLFDRYPPAIRELAREQGKRVRVIVEPSTVAVDKQVLDTIDSSLLHLARNSVDHGLEPAAERKASGKREHGTIVLSARQLGARVEISIRDDGRGIDVNRIRSLARQRRVVAADELEELDDDEVLQLIFEPGFSTRAEVTDISGRGVGLDVVKRQTEELGGTVRLATRLGRGSTFTMILPISVALSEVLILETAGVFYAVPATHVETVMRVPETEVERMGRGFATHVDGRRVPLVGLKSVLVAGAAEEPPPGKLEVAVLEHGGQRLAVWVRTVVGERRVMQQSAGRFLTGLRQVSGAVIIEGSRIALVVNVPELLHHWGEGRRTMVAAFSEELEAETARPPRVLVVDDSELTRDMLVGVARRLGVETAEAVNGRDGFDRLPEVLPDLVLTDLDMPVMNGFELIEQIRGSDRFRDLPVVVLSTRGAAEDKRRAMTAGANAYLVKAEFSETTFRDVLSSFLDFV